MIRIVGPEPPPPIMMWEETDPEELARSRAQHERFLRNLEWYQANISEIQKHPGKFYSIAGQELFVADTTAEAVALARSAHPEDDGRFTGYVPRDKAARIYANRRTMAGL